MKKPEDVGLYWYIIDNLTGVDHPAGIQQYWDFPTEKAAKQAFKEIKALMKRISRES